MNTLVASAGATTYENMPVDDNVAKLKQVLDANNSEYKKAFSGNILTEIGDFNDQGKVIAEIAICSIGTKSSKSDEIVLQEGTKEQLKTKDLLLTTFAENTAEKVQITETFGAPNVIFFGTRRIKSYVLSGVLFNGDHVIKGNKTMIFESAEDVTNFNLALKYATEKTQWFQKFKLFYATHLNSNSLQKKGYIARISFNNNYYYGYPSSVAFQKSATLPIVNFTMNWYIVKEDIDSVPLSNISMEFVDYSADLKKYDILQNKIKQIDTYVSTLSALKDSVSSSIGTDGDKQFSVFDVSYLGIAKHKFIENFKIYSSGSAENITVAGLEDLDADGKAKARFVMYMQSGEYLHIYSNSYAAGELTPDIYPIGKILLPESIITYNDISSILKSLEKDFEAKGIVKLTTWDELFTEVKKGYTFKNKCAQNLFDRTATFLKKAKKLECYDSPMFTIGSEKKYVLSGALGEKLKAIKDVDVFAEANKITYVPIINGALMELYSCDKAMAGNAIDSKSIWDSSAEVGGSTPARLASPFVTKPAKTEKLSDTGLYPQNLLNYITELIKLKQSMLEESLKIYSTLKAKIK